MKYIEKHYTEPNENGVIGCIFIPQHEEEAAPEQTKPETAPAETEPENAEPEKQEKPKKK